MPSSIALRLISQADAPTSILLNVLTNVHHIHADPALIAQPLQVLQPSP
jgi:hypothetical protein